MVKVWREVMAAHPGLAPVQSGMA